MGHIRRLHHHPEVRNMRAVVYRGIGDFQVVEREVPVISDPKDAVVRVTAASICSSDLHIRDGFVPRAVPGTVVGHEFVGVVESVGDDVQSVRPGDRVAVNVETYCGHCFFCQRGYVNNCTDPHGGWALGCRIDGGQAEYVRIPYADNALTPIPDHVSDDTALFTGDILSTGYWAADISEIHEGDVVVVIGAGPTGVCCAMCARLKCPSKVVMVEVREDRRRFVLEHGIADLALDPLSDDIYSIIGGLTDGRGADSVMEVAGSAGTFEMAWRVARPNAVVTVVAMYPEPQVIPLPDMYGKNLTFKTGGVDGCHCGEIMDLISDGRLDPSILISHEFTFDRIMEAYDLFASGSEGVMKVLIRM